LIHDFALYADRSGPHNADLFLFGELSASAQTQAYEAFLAQQAAHGLPYSNEGRFTVSLYVSDIW
jgi:hypothetical protein